jgi:hypothetical protein
MPPPRDYAAAFQISRQPFFAFLRRCHAIAAARYDISPSRFGMPLFAMKTDFSSFRLRRFHAATAASIFDSDFSLFSY